MGSTVDRRNRGGVCFCQGEIRVDRRRSLHEERHRFHITKGGQIDGRRGIRQREWSDQQLLLAAYRERRSAGDERLHRWALLEESSNRRAGGEHLFKVVEDEEQMHVAQRGEQRALHRLTDQRADCERLCNGGENLRGRLNRGERDKDAAIREGGAQFLRCRDGEARLADAAGSRDRQQSHAVMTEEGRRRRYRPFSPDQRRQRHGEIVRRGHGHEWAEKDGRLATRRRIEDCPVPPDECERGGK
jgi:hypothetical protein